MSDPKLIEAVNAAVQENRFIDAIGHIRRMQATAVAMKLEDHVLQQEAEYLRKTGERIQETANQYALRHQIASSSARARLEKMVKEGEATRAEEVRNGTRVVVYTYIPKL